MCLFTARLFILSKITGKQENFYMNYGTKPKPKPKVEQLTFNKAKNSWLNEWKGKGDIKRQ